MMTSLFPAHNQWIIFLLGPGSFVKSTLLTVLRQEIDRFNNLLSIINQSLHALEQGTKGEIVFTTGLEEIYNSVLKSKVPELWQVGKLPLTLLIQNIDVILTFSSLKQAVLSC